MPSQIASLSGEDDQSLARMEVIGFLHGVLDGKICFACFRREDLSREHPKQLSSRLDLLRYITFVELQYLFNPTSVWFLTHDVESSTGSGNVPFQRRGHLAPRLLWHTQGQGLTSSIAC